MLAQANQHHASDYEFPDLSHHLSQEARERIPNAMSLFRHSAENTPVISLANGNPHATLFALDQVDFYVPAVSTLGNVSSWIDRAVPAQKISTFKGRSDEKSIIDLAVTMQYGSGIAILRKQLAELNEMLHAPNPSTRNIVLSLGNGDAVAKLFRLLGSPGDTFLAEEFSFCGLINVPLAQGVRWQPVKIDQFGLIPDDMEYVLRSWDEATRGRRPHLLYCIPTGHNPTGVTIPIERRREIYAIAQKYDVIIVEDDPYYFLQYEKDMKQESDLETDTSSSEFENFRRSLVPSFLSLDTDGRVVRVDSVSKILAPGMRLGWVTTNALFSHKLQILIDNSTKSPHGLGQSLLSAILSPNGWGIHGYMKWVWGLRKEYTRRRDLFFKTFQREAGNGGFASTELPIAGMFFWVKIHLENHPRFLHLDPTPKTGPKTNAKQLMDALFNIIVKKGMLPMPGVLFAVEPTDQAISQQVSSEDHILDRAYFRMTFVGTDETIEKGLMIFGKALEEFFGDKWEDD